MAPPAALSAPQAAPILRRLISRRVIDVGSSATLVVNGLISDPGNLSLSALNTFAGYDQVTFKTGGAISGASAVGQIEASQDLAEVVIEGGAKLTSVGQIDLSADGSSNITTQVNTDTYGAVTAAEANSNIDIRPDNEIIIGNGSTATTITAFGDLDLLAGEDANFNMDSYTADAYTDAFAGAIIPLSSVNAHSFVVQTNQITVNSGAALATGGNANLIANSIGFASVFAQAKSTSWASDVGDSILSATGGNPANQFNGTGFAVSHGIVNVNGSIVTGINSNIDVTFSIDNAGSGAIVADFNGGPVLDWSLQTVTELSGLITSYLQMQQQLNTYLALQNALTTATTYKSTQTSVDLVSGNTVQDLSTGLMWRYSGSEQTTANLSTMVYNSANHFTQISIAQDDPTIDGQVTFDQQEVTAIQNQLLAQGLGEFDPVNPNNPNGPQQFVVTQRTVQVIDIPAFRAQAGQINIYGDQVEGGGSLNAPTTANVTITNFTAASLKVDGITIPQLLGGVFVNGALVTEALDYSSLPAAQQANPNAQQIAAATQAAEVKANAALNTANNNAANQDNEDPPSSQFPASAGVAHFSTITIAPPPAPPAPHQKGNAQILIDNEVPPNVPMTANGNLPNPSDVIIDGNIDALTADLTVIDKTGSIDITAPLIRVHGEFISAKNNLTFNEISFFTSGDPASQLLSTELGTPASLQAIGATQIANYLAAPPQTNDDAETIEITAETVDLNGAIQAGDANQTLNIDQTTALTNEIATIKARGETGLVALSSVSTTDFIVYYNTATNSLEVNNVVVSGGIITIKGAIYSTSQAQLNAFGYYGNVTINNTTNYNLIVNKIDVSNPGSGIIDITDLNQTYQQNGSQFLDSNGHSYALETKYLSQQTGGMDISTQYIDPLTGNILFSVPGTGLVGENTSTTNQNSLPVIVGTLVSASLPDPSHSPSSSAVYNPAPNLRYTFSVAESFQTTTVRTYQTSSWAGIISLGSSTNYSSQTIVTSAAQIEASSEYFYVDNSQHLVNGVLKNSDQVAYLFSSSTDTLSSTGFQPTANWNTSTWYGKKTYYQQDTDVDGDQTIAAHSVRADLQVAINFTGTPSSTITINSPNSAVTLLGDLDNITGNTIIHAGGPITQLNPGAKVEGVQVTMTVAGNGGIGTLVQPINVLLAGTSGQSLTATTTNGGVYIDAQQGGLVLGIITAGSDQAVNLNANLGITAFSSATVVTGGNVTIDAGGGVGTSGTPLKLDVGQAAGDQLNLDAKGDVYIDQITPTPGATSNLQLFSLTTTGQAFVTVDNGSLVNVNTNVHLDPRTVAQLESGVWSELQLTGTAAQTKVQQTLNEYQISQEQQYQQYWTDVNTLVADGEDPNSSSSVVHLSTEENRDYTTYFTNQGQAQGLIGSGLATFIAAGIGTIENSMTEAYHTLAAVYGPGGTYQPGTTNLYDVAVSTTNPITVASGVGTIANQTVIFGNTYVNGAPTGTITLASGGNWAALGYAVGQGLYIQASTATNPNGNGTNPNSPTNLYTIAAIAGSVITLKQGQALSVNTTMALVTINVNSTTHVDTSTAGSSTAVQVVYDNTNGAGTVTLLGGNTWASLGYTVGKGIYIGSATDPNNNGATFNAGGPNAYYTIASVSADGKTVTLTTGQTLNAGSIATLKPGQVFGASTTLAPVTINVNSTTHVDTSTVGSSAAAQVVYQNVNGAGTITLAGSSTWTSLGYAVGKGIYVGSSTDPNNNGATFSAGGTNAYYTIASISQDGKTVTLAAGQMLRGGTIVALQLAPVNVTTVLDSHNNTVVIDTYNPSIYDPNFTYMLTSDELSTLTKSIVIPTEAQLLSGISAGLLQTTTSTQVNVEDPNITATHIVISALNGNIGSITNPATQSLTDAGFVPTSAGGQPLVDGSAIQLALASAQRSDLNFLAASPVNEVVNFGSIVIDGTTYGTMTLTPAEVAAVPTTHDGWIGLGIASGQQLYIGGSTQNATNSGVYLTVAANPPGTSGISAVSASTVLFATGQKIISESSQQVLVAPVVVGSDQSVLSGAAVPTQVIFSDVGNVATITLPNGNWASLGYAAGGGIFIGSMTNANANGTAFDPKASNPWYTIASISQDGKTMTLALTGNQTFTSNVEVNLAKVTIDPVNGNSAGAAVATKVTYGNANGVATITLASGDWTSLGYTTNDRNLHRFVDGPERQRRDLQCRRNKRLLQDRLDQWQRRHGDAAARPDPDRQRDGQSLARDDRHPCEKQHLDASGDRDPTHLRQHRSGEERCHHHNSGDLRHRHGRRQHDHADQRQLVGPGL